MNEYTKQDIIKLVEDNDVEFIRLQFTDMFGTLKNVAITSSQLEKVLDNKCMFDGSAIDGFARIEEADMYLYPDLSSFVIFPWRPQQGKVARLICDVYRPDGTPFEGDPRFVLKRVIKDAATMGYTFDVGPELEFFLFHTDDEGQPTTITHEKASYFDVSPLDLGENARRDMVLTLEDMGFEIEGSHHEVAPAQHEIDFKYDNALATADNIMTFKFVVKTIAKRHGLYASFMPKPVSNVDGSGMHISMSLKKDGKNIFAKTDGELGLSEEAYHFMAGIMKYARGMSVFTNPLVNSYKRLVPGYEAPVCIAWSTINRSPLIRIPTARGASTRIELRSPDPAANPYLVLAICLAAGLDGIRNKRKAPKSIDKNIYTMSLEEKEAAGITCLPSNLGSAVEALREEDFIKQVLGEHVVNKYIEAKTEEYSEYNKQVSEWEIKEYLYKI